MKKRFLISGLLALSIIACSTPIINTSQDFSDLEKEYNSFSTKALSDAYVKRMFGKYLSPVNSVQLTRQLEFSRFLKNNGDTSYETSLKNMFSQTPSLYDTMTGTSAPEIQNKISTESATFGDFVRGLSPYSFSTLTKIQSIPTNGGNDSEFFTIGTDNFLAIANEFNVVTRTVNSNIYKWNSSTNQFAFYQGITTNGARHWEFFTIGTDHYLAVANYATDSSTSTSSNIYKWNPSTSLFSYIQSISTNGANDIKFFTTGTDNYIVTANYVGAFSYLYKFNTSTGLFNTSAIQSISTTNVVSLKFFTIGTDNYLVYGGSSSSKLYKWNKDTSQFNFLQTFTTAYYWEYFTIGSDSYLVGGSKIYKWDSSQFIEFQTLPVGGGDWEYFTIGSNTYIAGSGGTSRIYKWDSQSNQFIEFTSFISSGINDIEFFKIGANNYLAASNWYNGSYILNAFIYRFD